MKNKIITAILFLTVITCQAQEKELTVAELVKELSFFSSGEEWGNKRNIAHQLLAIDSLNTTAIKYLVEAYGRSNQRDSISFLFDKLINENPKSPEPYLLRASEQNAHFAGLTYTQRIKYLKEAHKLDSLNEEAIYSLGKLYYELFIKEYKKSGKKVNLDHYSSSATKYFTKLFDQNDRFKESLKFPLIQLANYSGNAGKKKHFESFRIQSSYFPIYDFADLPEDWRTNYKVNVLKYIPDNEYKVSGVESAVFHVRWYASNLQALQEPVLVDTLPAKVFRFTWLRSFHNPVVIRLENINDSITLYWKVSNGAGGYEPGEIIVNKSKPLTIKEWEDFVAGINSINFWKLPTIKSGILGTDGAQWILEGKELGKYHVVDRWSGGIIYNACMKLLELSDMEIKQSEIY